MNDNILKYKKGGVLVDNNFIFQLQSIEKGQNNKVKKLNKVTSVKKDINKEEESFKSVYKKIIDTLRKEKQDTVYNNDIVVDQSLKKILKYNKKVKEVINNKLSTSNALMRILNYHNESPNLIKTKIGGMKDED